MVVEPSRCIHHTINETFIVRRSQLLIELQHSQLEIVKLKVAKHLQSPGTLIGALEEDATGPEGSLSDRADLMLAGDITSLDNLHLSANEASILRDELA